MRAASSPRPAKGLPLEEPKTCRNLQPRHKGVVHALGHAGDPCVVRRARPSPLLLLRLGLSLSRQVPGTHRAQRVPADRAEAHLQAQATCACHRVHPQRCAASPSGPRPSCSSRPGDPRRFAGQGGLARFNGTAPLPASSAEGDGQPERHRLNRGGSRRINAVLHRMAVTQLRCDERAQKIYNHARQHRHTKKEAMRILKRHLSNVVYRRMMSRPQTALGRESLSTTSGLNIHS